MSFFTVIDDGSEDAGNVAVRSILLSLQVSMSNQTLAEARRALERFEGSAHGALAQTDDEEYENQTRKLSL